jgi:hypothetical protein
MIGASLNEASDRPFLTRRRGPRFSWRAIDLGQWSLSVLSHRHSMTPPEELIPGKDEPLPKLSRLEEARRSIEEYAAELREIIKKLRKRLN